MPITLSELASRISSGCSLAVASDFNGFFSGVAMAVTRELVRQRVTGLRLIAVPSTGLQADLLIGAGCVSELECGAVIHAEHGATPRFLKGFHDGTLTVRESTCPAIFHGLTAAEKGAPFMAVRGVLGSQLTELRPDWRVIANPFDESEPLVVVPPIRPDVALFHAPMADTNGNVWIGRRREFALMAHAARTTLVTVERIHQGDLMAHRELGPGTLSAVYIDAIACCEKGAWPFGMGSDYQEDTAHIAEYLALANSDEGFERYLKGYVHGRRDAN
ncbi:MAG: CoA transferase subunit A [Lautropia sp.]